LFIVFETRRALETYHKHLEMFGAYDRCSTNKFQLEAKRINPTSFRIPCLELTPPAPSEP
jgi:hypothetical protein